MALICAAAVCRRRAVPLRLALLKGRRGLAAKETELFDEIVSAVGGNGVLVHDRGFDSEEFVSHAHASGHRAVVRMKVTTRDVFGTGRSVEADMADAPCAKAALRSPTRRAEAVVRWRSGFFPSSGAFLPVLVVSSTFGGCTLHLYAVNFCAAGATRREQRDAAVAAANSYFCRWSVEVLFQDVKQCFRIEDARVRTFARLENLLAMCTLAYTYFAHVLPFAGEESRRLLKAMRDGLGRIVEGFRPFVANVRALLEAEKTRYIAGRPERRSPRRDAVPPGVLAPRLGLGASAGRSGGSLRECVPQTKGPEVKPPAARSADWNMLSEIRDKGVKDLRRRGTSRSRASAGPGGSDGPIRPARTPKAPPRYRA